MANIEWLTAPIHREVVWRATEDGDREIGYRIGGGDFVPVAKYLWSDRTAPPPANKTIYGRLRAAFLSG